MATVTVPRKPSDSLSHAAPRVLKFLIAYESVEIGLQALQLYQRVAKRFSQEYRFQLDLWKFEALGVPSLANHAADEAAAADLVIIAANRDDRVPLDLRIWIDKWGERMAAQDAALVLLSGRSRGALDSPPLMEAYLRDVAKLRGMTFLSNSIGAMGRVRNAFMEQIRERACQAASVKENLFDREIGRSWRNFTPKLQTTSLGHP